MYWGWRGTPPRDWQDWLGFALFGAALHVAAYAVYSWWLRRWQLAALRTIVLSGVAGGLVGGVLAHAAWPRIEESIELRATLAVPMVLAAILVGATRSSASSAG
jgi:hypothetical protein